ncbi:MAG: hypothetical protein DDT37_01570 [Firmicutes bacterium]|nr:hypothetical protein [candidate division NPL-UPA2 bacterium]
MNQVNHQLAQKLHIVLIIEVGTIPLHHGEVLQMSGADTFVAETARHLKYVGKPANDQALEVHLGCNAQVQVYI